LATLATGTGRYAPGPASSRGANPAADTPAAETPAIGQAIELVAKNQGLDNAEPRTPQSTTPTSFRQWCEEILKPAVLA
jgi:hypothetical protein